MLHRRHRERCPRSPTPIPRVQAAVFQLAELDAQTAATIAAIGGPFLSIAELAFILRCGSASFRRALDAESRLRRVVLLDTVLINA